GPRRIYASIKFFIYTLVGSVLMLIAMLALYFWTGDADGVHTFNLLSIHAASAGFDFNFQYWIFLGLFFGFAIKVPVFPFHTWLPDAHVEAPTAISVILAGVLLKMGGYGFFRMSYPFAPDVFAEQFTLLIGALGVINLVYGALVAMAQTDFKKLVAYSSVSHMGYVMLGLAAFSHGGVQGSALQMINHGVSSAMMFLLVGVVYDRAHHRDLNRFGGLALKMPIYASLAMIGMFASLGLPGLNGFISEAMVFLGMWDTGASYLRPGNVGPGIDYTWMIFASLPGIVLTAAYILWTIQRVFMGTVREEQANFPDLNWRELVAIVPLAILCIVLGVLPNLVLQYLSPTLTTLVEAIRGAI
ncbi:MAG: complex I subunit 4 family protein, partial [Planctomycetota bacterium]